MPPQPMRRSQRAANEVTAAERMKLVRKGHRHPPAIVMCHLTSSSPPCSISSVFYPTAKYGLSSSHRPTPPSIPAQPQSRRRGADPHRRPHPTRRPPRCHRRQAPATNNLHHPSPPPPPPPPHPPPTTSATRWTTRSTPTSRSPGRTRPPPPRARLCSARS